MTKLISIILSISILFTSVAPSYGEALEGVRREQARVGAVFGSEYRMVQDNTRVAGVEIERMVMEQMLEAAKGRSEALGGLDKEVALAVEALSGEGMSEREEYERFVGEYKKALAGAMERALKGVGSEEERGYIRAGYKKLLAEGAIREAYEGWYKEQKEASLVAAEEYIRDLGRRVYKAGQEKGGDLVKGLIEEGLTVFSAVGWIDKEVKEWAAAEMRKEVEQGAGLCGEVGLVNRIRGKGLEQGKECAGVVKAASALVVLGEGGRSADSEAIGKLMRAGYKGVQGPSVIMVCGSGLLAMGSQDELVGVISEVAKEQPKVGILGKDFSFLSLQDWVRASKAMTEGGDWAVGHGYSFYKSGEGYGNAWMDLGEYIGEKSRQSGAEGKAAREVGERISRQTVVASGNGDMIIQFPVFMSGLLAGGYRLGSQGRAGWELNGAGVGSYVDTRSNWEKVEERAKGLGMSISGYAIGKLYYAGKSDLDPYTKVNIENRLALGYKKSGSEVKGSGIEERKGPSAEEVGSYNNWQKALKVAGGVDIALMVVGVVAIGSGLIKAGVSGARAVGQMGRAFKIARAGAAGEGIRANIAAYERVIRIGRLQKYGTSSWREILIKKLSVVSAGEAKAASQGVKEAAAGKEVQGAVKLSEGQIEANAQAWVSQTAQMERAKAQAAAAWRAEQAQKEAARLAAEGASRGRAVQAGGSAPAGQAAYVKVPGRNVLGEEVMTWRAVNAPAPGAKPSLWNHFVRSTKESLYGLTYDAKNLFGQIGTGLRKHAATVMLAMSLNMPLAQTSGVAGALKAQSGINSLVRTEQVFTGARTLVQEAAAVSRGGLAAESAALKVGAGTQAASEGIVALKNVKTVAGLGGGHGGAGHGWAWLFAPVAVTPESERRLGLGNFFKFKVGKPQFLLDYAKDLKQYEQKAGNYEYSQMSAEDRDLLNKDPDLFEFKKWQKDKQALSVQAESIRLYWQQQGYPLTGKIQSFLQLATRRFHTYSLAPLSLRDNPYYQNYNNQNEDVKELDNKNLFQYGTVDYNVLTNLVKDILQEYAKDLPLLKGQIPFRFHNRKYRLALEMAVLNAETAAKEEWNKLEATQRTQGAYARLLRRQLAASLEKLNKIPQDVKKAVAVAVGQRITAARKSKHLIGDGVRLVIPSSLRKHFDQKKTIVIPFYDEGEYRLAQKYHFIRTESHYTANPALAQWKSDLISGHILLKKTPIRSSLFWILASAASPE